MNANGNGHIAIIGFGAIAKDLVSILYAEDAAPPALSVLVRNDTRIAEVQKAVREHDGDALVTADIAELLARKPDLVIEAAGHEAIRMHAPAVLAHGTDMLIASVGALADDDLIGGLKKSAGDSGAQIIIPAGAIGGIDALAAAKLSGLESVRYTGRKPPAAWRGTPAEDVADLENLREECRIFSGTAREAARQFPKNANVAATLALAGMGMDATQVVLYASPDIKNNVHEFEVESAALSFAMKITGKPSPENPKTSQGTVLSIARGIMNRKAAIVI